MSTSTRTLRKATNEFVLCVETGEYDGELVVGKLYRRARAEKNDPPSDIRIIDESGEDYLYPSDWFVPIDVPARGRKALAGSR